MQKMTPWSRKSARRGGSTIELALLSPWILFLFVGALDFGFYNYALISVQNAARVAVLHTSTNSGVAGDTSGACTYVLGELQNLPNVGSSMSTCSSPVSVTAAAVSGPDGASASKVTVTYTTMLMIPIPGLLNNQFTFQASETMRLRN
jgi:Flp pilus assembly protein TadG